jgi:hypothetical protein
MERGLKDGEDDIVAYFKELARRTEDNHMDNRCLLEIPTDSDWPL